MIESKVYQEDLTYVANLEIFNKLKDKSVMVTGSCGLIGSFLVDAIMMRNKLYNDNITVIAEVEVDIKIELALLQQTLTQNLKFPTLVLHVTDITIFKAVPTIC